MTTTEHTWTGLDGQIHGHDDQQVRAERAKRVAQEAKDVENAIRWVLSYVQQAERDMDTATMTLDSLVKPGKENCRTDRHVELLTEARRTLVAVRDFRRMLAPEYGTVSLNAGAAEREAAGIGQPLPEDGF